MNEHVGFLTCPNCKCAWHDGQFACSYCGGLEPPPAIKAAGPAWVWWLFGVAAVLGLAIDYCYGGHVLRFLQDWSKSNG